MHILLTLHHLPYTTPVEVIHWFYGPEVAAKFVQRFQMKNMAKFIQRYPLSLSDRPREKLQGFISLFAARSAIILNTQYSIILNNFSAIFLSPRFQLLF